MSVIPKDLVELGRVVSAYGVRGWVKIQPYAADGDALLTAKRWWLKTPVSPAHGGGAGVSASTTPFTVQQAKWHSGTVVALFKGFDDRNQSEPLKAHTVWVSRADFPAADEEEFYWVDLLDCLLYGEEEGGQSALLGRVAQVLDNGAHAVLEVEQGSLDDAQHFTPVLSAKGKRQTILVPFVKECVHTVDLAAKRLDSNWPVGF